MEPSLEIAVQYLFTWLDLWRLGARRFYFELQRPSNRYLSSAHFFFTSLAICGCVMAITIGTLLQVPKNTQAGINYSRFFGDDPKLFIARRLLLIGVIIFLSALQQRLVLWWPLRSPSDLKDILQAKFYSSGILLTFVVFDCMFAWVQSLIIPHLSHSTAVKELIWSGAGEFLLFVCVYGYFDICTICAFCKVKFRRLCEGALILAVSMSAFTTPLGGLIGSYFDHRGGQPFDSGDLIIFAFLLLPAVIALFLLKFRVSRLQSLVRAEYYALS
jgi:hypothetical protein